MDEQDEILSDQPVASNVQLHEIKPVAEGMSFGALLDKFYMSIEAADTTAKAVDSATQSQDFIKGAKKATGASKA
jgi:hypothetical protein